MSVISRVRATAAAAVLAATLPALAVDSVKILVPANPGGGWDTTGRELGKAMQGSGAVKSVQYDNKGGAAGTIGLAPSANLNPDRRFPSLFEPVHGSAPDIYGQNIANPVAMIWSGAMMLDFLGERAAHDAIVEAIERVLVEGPRTRDLGGQASTTEMGEAIAARI